MMKINEIIPRPGCEASWSTNSFPAYAMKAYFGPETGFDWIKEFIGVNPKHSVIRAKLKLAKVILPWLLNKQSESGENLATESLH